MEEREIAVWCSKYFFLGRSICFFRTLSFIKRILKDLLNKERHLSMNFLGYSPYRIIIGPLTIYRGKTLLYKKLPIKILFLGKIKEDQK